MTEALQDAERQDEKTQAVELAAWRERALAGWVAAALPAPRSRAWQLASVARRQLSVRVLAPARLARSRRAARRRA